MSTFKIENNTLYTSEGIPYLWGTGDSSTPTSNGTIVERNDTNAEFGYSIAFGGDLLLIGAPNDTGISANTGAAYLYSSDGGYMNVKFSASDGKSGVDFGHSVAISSDVVVIGARLDDPGGIISGSAYLFNHDGTLIQKLVPSDGFIAQFFGWSVAVKGNLIAVGAPVRNVGANGQGSVYLYNKQGTFIRKILPSTLENATFFGESVVIRDDMIIVGAPRDSLPNGIGSGAVYIFDLDGNQIRKISASDGNSSHSFGRGLSAGNNRIVVGAPGKTLNDGGVYIFDYEGNELSIIEPPYRNSNTAQFGVSVGIGSGRIVVGTSVTFGQQTSGTAHLYDFEGNYIEEIIRVVPQTATSTVNGFFGFSVAAGYSKIAVSAYQHTGGPSPSPKGGVFLYTTPPCYLLGEIIESYRGLA